MPSPNRLSTTSPTKLYGRPSGRAPYVNQLPAGMTMLTSLKAAMGVYPFMFGAIKDFEPVAQEIIKVGSETVPRKRVYADVK